jgi:hypothetical protein
MTTTYTVPDNPPNPEGAALELIVRQGFRRAMPPTHRVQAVQQR